MEHRATILCGSETLTRLRIEPFEPHVFLKNAWGQTLAASYGSTASARKSSIHDIPISEADRIRIAEDLPQDFQEGKEIVILIHGLVGSYRSNYMIRLSEKIYSQSLGCIRVNLRGYGEGISLSRDFTHAGRTEDVRTVVDWARKRYPRSPVTLVGFSLGGNLVLKMAAEASGYGHSNLKQIIAISPPIDLSASVNRMTKSTSRVFDYYFTARLKKLMEKRHQVHPDLGTLKWPKKMTLRDFDHIYTAPRAGFAGVDDYYEKSSSAKILPQIRIPTLILAAQDDPIVDSNCLTELNSSPNLSLVLTRFGGHMGFIGPKFSYWMDEFILKNIAYQRPESVWSF